MIAALAATPPAAAAPNSALSEASASLDRKAQCVPFKWLANDKGSARGAITVPVDLNGRMLRMQLDTGADATSLYGHFAEKAGWAKAGNETFRAATFTVAGAVSLMRTALHTMQFAL